MLRVSILSLLIGLLPLVSHGVRADEGIKQKSENAYDDTTNSAAKQARKGQQAARKAWGTDNAAKDAKDSAENAQGDTKTEAKKAKRKAESAGN